MEYGKKFKPSHTAGSAVKCCNGPGKQSGIELPYDPAILLLGVYPREMKIQVYTYAFTQVFTEVVFITGKK